MASTLYVRFLNDLSISFVSYLQYKHQHDQAGPVVKLGGLWANVNFDVSDQDVRTLRHQLTLQLAGRM
jgi:hypothetical protein